MAPTTTDPSKPKEPKRLKLSITKRVMKTSEYKKILSAQLQAMSGLLDDDEVEVNVNAEQQ